MGWMDWNEFVLLVTPSSFLDRPLRVVRFLLVLLFRPFDAGLKLVRVEA